MIMHLCYNRVLPIYYTYTWQYIIVYFNVNRIDIHIHLYFGEPGKIYNNELYRINE